MAVISTIFIILIAALHMWILYFEMFLWTKPYGLNFSRMEPEIAEGSRTLAANQGLYNGFIAAGLFYGLLCPNDTASLSFKIFFLICVVIAGCYGGWSSNRRIFWIQGFPALITLAILYFI